MPSTRASRNKVLQLLSFSIVIASTFLSMPLPACGQASVLTQHNDNMRTGQNLNETVLNASNVNVNQFGLLFTLPTQGVIYAQPLYVPNLTIDGVAHNVLFVATEEDYVYAFDADKPGPPLWQVSLIDAAHGGAAGEQPVSSSVLSNCNNLQPNIGITSTPVIDPESETIYLEADSTVGSGASAQYFHRLHALSLTTGREESQGPAVIKATVNGTGDGSVGGKLTFSPFYHLNRPGLLLLNGSIYVAFASNCDISPFHGWLFSYSASTFAQQSVFVTTPNGGDGGFWMAGAGVAADQNNNIFISTGNGDFNTTSPNAEYGDTLLKLGTAGGQLSVLDSFTPSNQACEQNDDHDLGSAGVMLLPPQTGTYPDLLITGSKDGAVFVVNRDQMTTNNTHYNNGGSTCTASNGNTNDPEILEESGTGTFSRVITLPAYWAGSQSIYYWTTNGHLKAIPIIDGLPSFSNITTNATELTYPGSNLSISSNGVTAGTGILWAVDDHMYGPPANTGPAVLHAIDLRNISNELWNSSMAPSNRDQAGNAVKFTVPTVVDGKVYIGTTAAVDVYGLLATTVSLASEANTIGIFSDGTTLSSGGLDGEGHAYSSTELGSSVTLSGTTFSFLPANEPDAVSGAGAPVITLPAGNYSALNLLGTGDFGNQGDQDFTVTYTDGTSTQLAQSLSDWWSSSANSGETIAVHSAYLDLNNGTKLNQQVDLYEYSIPLDTTKTVKSLTLPNNPDVVLLAAELAPPIPVPTSAPSLSAAANVIGIFSDGTTLSSGGLDGEGHAYSSTELGTLVSLDGLAFPLLPANASNAVTGAGAPSIALPAGNYSALSFLGMGMYGDQPGQVFTVTYSDGTTTKLTQSLSDWWGFAGNKGETVAVHSDYLDLNTGTELAQPVDLYEYSMPLNSSKTVQSFTLPNNPNVAVFSIALSPPVAINSTAVSLVSSVNATGIFSDGATLSNGGLDGEGDAYSSTELGSSVTLGGVPFTLLGPNVPDVVKGEGAPVIPLPAGSYSLIDILGAGMYGNQTGQVFTVTYTDGTTAQFTQGTSDWWSSSDNSGETIAIHSVYLDQNSGKQLAQPVDVYEYSFALNNTKTVKSITLPNNPNVAVLAMSLVQ
jgi:hypothetical protein